MRRFRYILFLLICLLSISMLNAETISQKEAKRIATQFFNAAYGQVMSDPNYVYNGKRLTTDRLFTPFYVYNHPAGGFVVISAENKAFPILGYSLTENFDPERIGEGTTNLLRLYAKHIENIRYDAHVPHEAISAWQNIPNYIHDILSATYSATDVILPQDEVISELAYTAATFDAEASSSAFYQPDQWQEIINTELDEKGNIALGIMSDTGIYPAVIHGRQGEYYRLKLDGVNKQLWRLLPTEILSQGEMAVFGNPPKMPIEELEEVPFQFYDNYIRTIRKEYYNNRAAIEDALIVYEPIVRWHGLGHYTVTLPEAVCTMRVYALDGSQLFAEKFRDTNTANINLTSLPSGFYFAVIFGESGMPYDVKLFR